MIGIRRRQAPAFSRHRVVVTMFMSVCHRLDDSLWIDGIVR